MTPIRTWASSSPNLRPGSSHQGPSLSETWMLGSQDRPSVLFSPQGLPGKMKGGAVLWGPISLPLRCPQSSLRTLPCLQAGPGTLSLPQTWPCPSNQVHSLSETWMLQIEDRPRAQIPHRDLPGPKVGLGICGVASDWGPGSPESSVSVLPLTSWRTWTLPSAYVRSHPLS